jgi:hypothetical protein
VRLIGWIGFNLVCQFLCQVIKSKAALVLGGAVRLFLVQNCVRLTEFFQHQSSHGAANSVISKRALPLIPLFAMFLQNLLKNSDCFISEFFAKILIMVTKWANVTFLILFSVR